MQIYTTTPRGKRKNNITFKIIISIFEVSDSGEDYKTMVNLTRSIPKLNSMYRVTINSSKTTINCRINFKIIDFMYESMMKKAGFNKSAYIDKLYEFMNIGEKQYEALRNGDRVTECKWDKSYRNIKTYKLISDELHLELNGVSVKQWKRYFWILKKLKELRKGSADKSLIAEAERQKSNFEKKVFDKISNKEMNKEASIIYNKLADYLFKDELSRKCKEDADRWLRILEEIHTSDLEQLLIADKNKYKQLRMVLHNKLKIMQEIQKQQ